ncbi:MAG: dual specificity protein phosphatase family protein [Planctomycetaceae bacterium]|nr:dual specificity protein phosphatase family protein [Planctomycetaceae bacterium]
MKYGILFLTAALLMAVYASRQGGWMLLMLWPAASFGLVGLAYLFFGPRLFGKQADGTLRQTRVLLLLPYLGYLWTIWHALRLVKREPAFNQLSDRLLIGRRLLAGELPDEVDVVLDLTCEFPEPASIRSREYRSFPILDGFVPEEEQLPAWVNEACQLPGTLYIHCAEGHGRTGLFAALMLLASGQASTPEEALRFIRSRRPGVRLGSRQLQCLRNVHAAQASGIPAAGQQSAGPDRTSAALPPAS